MSLYESLMKPWLFRMDPERAHELALDALECLQRVPGAAAALSSLFKLESPSLRTRLGALRLANPVGLAAGFDKDGRVPWGLAALGFGFLEIGTVTPRPQAGQPKPRLFRVPERRALINRMGFNNAGAEALAARLKRFGPLPVPVGINLGVNADTPAEKAPWDYGRAFELLRELGDYFVVNVSSPNTDRLRDLQDRLRLERILTEIDGKNPKAKPVFVKLSPDMEKDRLAELAPLLVEAADGLILCNTTISRDGLDERYADLRGGLSGEPLEGLSTGLLAEARRLTEGRLPLIGAGGVLDAEDAYRKLRAGASAIQVYTGLVYRGPGFVRELKAGLLTLLKQHGFSRIEDAVGAAVAA